MNTLPPDFNESDLWGKVKHLPRNLSMSIVEKALTLYAILTDEDTPKWVKALVLAALVYLINPFDAIPDIIPGIGYADDIVAMTLALERTSRYVTPKVKARVKRLMSRNRDTQKERSKKELSDK